MKLKVFFRTIGYPFSLAAVILWPPSDRLSVRLFLLIGTFVWLFIALFLNKRKYLVNLIVKNDKVHIRFITPILLTKDLQLNIEDISGLRVCRANFPYTYAGSIRVFNKGFWYTFIIIDNKLFETTERQIATANIGGSCATYY